MAVTDQAAAFDAFLHAEYQRKNLKDMLQKARARAWEKYLILGLPSKKTEVYRYIKLRHLFSSYAAAKQEFNLAFEDLASWIYPECLQSVIIFVNGSYRSDLSRIQALPSNVVVSSLSEASRTFHAFLTNQWTKSVKEERDPFVALNGALHDEGLFLYLPPQCVVKTPIQILNFISHKGEDPMLVMPRIHVMVGKQAQVSLASSTCVAGQTKYGINQVFELSLEEGAQVQVMQTSDAEEGNGWHFEALRASLKRDSLLKTIYISEGSLTTRYDYRTTLEGENAEASLNGVWMLKDKREAHTHVLMEHQAPHCRSNQLFKGVLNHFSRSSFEGKIFVQQEAQKTEAFQLNSNLLISDHAHADSKPNLEIFADDVKASHGATIGQLNFDEIFYLTTKGIPQAMAKNLLINGFCKEVIEMISIPSLQEKLCLLSQRINCE